MKQRKGRYPAEMQLPVTLVEALKQEPLMCTMASFSQEGIPHIYPIHFIYPIGKCSLLIMMDARCTAYKNMTWQKKVMLSFMNKKNMSYSILMRAGVVRAPSFSHPEMNIVRVDTIEIFDNKSPFIQINQPVQWQYLSPEIEELCQYVMDEIKLVADAENK